VTTHVVEVGPSAIRELCCGGSVVADSQMVQAAFDSIDDPVTLVDLRPITVDSLWRTVLASVDCGSPERAFVVHPSWWAPARIGVVSAAAQVLAGEVVMRPRSWLLTQASPPESQHSTVAVEIADCFVVITGAAVVAETRRGEPRWVVRAVVRSILNMTSDGTATVVIDAPSKVGGAGALAAMIAEGLRGTDGITAMQVGDARLRELAAAIIRDDDSTCESDCIDAAGLGNRRHWTLALAVMLIIAVVGVLGVLAPGRHAAPARVTVPTTFLVEGFVALEVPAQWSIQRVVAGPGSARVQVTSPSDPEVALHVTQSRVAIGTLDAAAESLKHAIDVEPAGVFVDFNPVGNSAGRQSVTYREVRSAHDIRWTVLVDKAVRISIGCQSRHGHDDAVRQVCELAVRSARAVR
jgi:type VII secretion-associated protein (TIGR03931 family)